MDTPNLHAESGLNATDRFLSKSGYKPPEGPEKPEDEISGNKFRKASSHKDEVNRYYQNSLELMDILLKNSIIPS